MRRHAAVTFLLSGLLAWLPTAPAGAQGAATTEERIDRFIEAFADLGMFDGSVLVDVGGEVRYESSFGLAHHELGVPHRRDTRFRIASVSKTLTDAAFGVLVERGDLALDTPIALYLPDFPSAGEITVGHLLSHSSGIPHTNGLPWGDATTSLSLDEIVRRLAQLPLDFSPGSDTSYSNGGYAVAAKILERVGGASYGEVLRETVLGPLGMGDTGHIDDARMPIARMATGYEPGPRPGSRRHARFYAVETRPGGGSLYSTVGDLLRFARGLFRGGFLQPATLETVLGFEGGAFLSQGRSPGFVAKLLYEAEADAIVISLANSYAVPADWARAIADLALGERETGWLPVRPDAASVAADDPRVGRYRNSFGGGTLSIERDAEGGLVLRDEESDSVTGLVLLEGGAFLNPLYFQRCEGDPGSGVLECRMLSGNPRYTSELTPLETG